MTVDLVSPADGTTIRLFTQPGSTTQTQSNLWFSNTVLADTGTSPIQTGTQPFNNGPYTPQFPLSSSLDGTGSAGTWFGCGCRTPGPKMPNLTGWTH